MNTLKLFKLSLLLLLILGLMVALSAGPEAEASSAAQISSKRLVTVLASSQRTATTTSDDFINSGLNTNVKGAYVTLDVTAVLTSPVITLTVQAKDPVSDNYEAVLTASSGVSAAGTHTYLIYPGAGAAAGDVVQTLSYPLPPQWRVSVEHTDTDPITYSVGALLIQ